MTVPGSDVVPVPSGGVPVPSGGVPVPSGGVPVAPVVSVSVVSPVLVSVPVLPGAVAGSVAVGVASGWVPASVPIDVSGSGVLPVPSAGVAGVLPVLSEVSSMAGTPSAAGVPGEGGVFAVPSLTGASLTGALPMGAAPGSGVSLLSDCGAASVAVLGLPAASSAGASPGAAASAPVGVPVPAGVDRSDVLPTLSGAALPLSAAVSSLTGSGS